MKKWSRLTALVLAFAIVLSTVSGALAQIEIDHGEFQTWVADTKEAEGLSGVISIDEGGEVLVAPSTFTGELNQGPLYTSESTQNLSAYAQGSAPTVDVALGQYSKVELAAPSAGQWQVYLSAADLWVNITGETGSTFALTYAKVKGMIDADGAAKIRCLMGENATETVNVTVRYEDAAVVVNSTATVSQPMVMSARTVAADAQAEGEVKETYSVIINYVFADGEQAANPWTAKVVAGSSVSQTVASPAVIGYTPDQASVDINIENIAADTKYTVTYSAALVQYKVRHYQQNLNDNDYTLVTEETKTGYTDTAVGEDLETTYTGFYALLYDESTEIAADSSTVVEIYYDRYYFLMSFDLDGGYGDDCEPIYARFGAPVSAGTPTKAGYAFAGWKDAESGAVYTVDNFPYKTMPAMNTKFVAQWTAGNTTYDVVFWYENADDDGYSQAGVLRDQAGVAGSVVNGASYQNANFTGKDSSHFTYSHADENVKLKGDGSTVVNVYFRRNVYTLTFEMGDWANSCNVATHRHGDSCYTLSCPLEAHTHDSCSSELTCTIPVHVHSSSCCTKEEHNHQSSGCIWILGWLCGKTEHTHGDGNCICSATNHSHGEACYTYSCGKVAHTHTAVTGTCYDLTCGKFEHYHSGNTCYLIVKAKYDSDITNVWKENPVSAVINAGYVFESSVTGDYYSFLEKMPGQNITLKKYNMGSTTKYIYYYLEVLPNQDLTGLTVKEATKNGVKKTYYLYKTLNPSLSSGAYLTYAEDYFPITGFTQRDDDVPSFSSNNNKIEAYLYYVRNSYTLAFSNNGTLVSGKGGTFLYEQDISGQYFVPDYPSTLEPDAYVFEGWYTSPFFGDTKFEFTTTDEEGNVISKATMPAKDITLYARWVPKNHNVNIYLTEDLDTENKVGETQVVAHRETATNPYPDVNNPPKHPASDLYQFVGWFYMDGETEKAFDFSMPVTQDLDLYAKWSSNTLIEYTIRYAVKNADDTLTYIAEDTTGSGLAGTTKTFAAKAGEELNEGYQSGYFPTTNSHSLTLDIVDLKNNEYTFIYVPKEELPYKVLYLEYDGNDVYDGTETQLHDPKTAKTRDAIITETFKPKTGYMPDAYQKRLVLSANEAENVIIFWYTKDAVHAPVQIIHYIQNAEGDDYSIYQESTDLNGVIDQSYSTNVLNITGFDYDHATANEVAVEAVNDKVTGTVTANGLILELYYVREVHPYEFRFLEQGTNKKLADPVTGEARYGSQVTQTAKTIPGYKLVSEEAQAITIQIEDGDTAEKNVRIFYYVEEEVLIKYVAVGPEGFTDFGTVTPTSNTIGAVNGPEPRSLADANDPTYKFVGWFTNPECTIPVNSAWLSGTVENDQQVIEPQKQDHDNDATTAAIYVGATYYAKFEYNVADLAISKTVRKDPNNEANIAELPDESFTFTVSGLDAGTTYTYSINGGTAQTLVNNTLTLKNGETAIIKGVTIGTDVTVTETLTADQQKYFEITAPAAGSAEIKIAPDTNAAENVTTNVVAFTNTYKKLKTGNLQVNKTVLKSDMEAAETFEFTISLPTGTEGVQMTQFEEWVKANSNKISISVSEDGTAVSGKFENLPVGNYEIVESGKPANTVYTTLYGTDQTATKATAEVVADQTAEVNVTNIAADKGDIIVQKIWVDESNKYQTRNNISLVLTLKNGDEAVQTITLTADDDTATADQWNGVFTNVDLYDDNGDRIDYTVVEAELTDYEATEYTSLAENDYEFVQVTNTLKQKDLTITKTVEDDKAPKNAVFQFMVTVDGQPVTSYVLDEGTVDAENGVVRFVAGNSVTIPNVNVGAECVVEEINIPVGFAIDAPANQKQTVTMDSDGQTVEFKNVYTTGNLVVSKTVAGLLASSTQPFTFTLDLKDDKNADMTTAFTYNKYTLDASGNKVYVVQNLSIRDGGTFTLTHGQYAEILDLPTRTVYTVAEEAHASYAKTVVGDETGSITVDDAEVAYTNTYKSNTLTIEKTGMASGENAIFVVENNETSKKYEVVVPNGGSVTLTLPEGTYSITETGDWTWRYTTGGIADATITYGGEAQTREVKNTPTNDKWLDSEQSVTNKFTTTNTTK